MIKTGHDFLSECSQPLAHFKHVFDHGSFLLAAPDCGKSPSQLSRIIKALEDSFGFSLFERARQGLIPTQEGKKLYHLVSEMEIAFVKHFPPTVDSSERYTVTIGANSYARATIIPRLIAKLYAVCKNTNFVVCPLERETHEATFDLTLLSKPIAEGYTSHVIFTDSLWLVGDPATQVARLALGPDPTLNDILLKRFPGPIPTIDTHCFYALVDVAAASSVTTIIPGALLERSNVALTRHPMEGSYSIYASINKGVVDHPKLRPVRSLLDAIHLEAA